MHPHRPMPEPEIIAPTVTAIAQNNWTTYATLQTEHGYARIAGTKPWFKRRWRFKETDKPVPKEYWPAIERQVRAWEAQKEARESAPWKRTKDAVEGNSYFEDDGDYGL